jgi:hypothetical protein
MLQKLNWNIVRPRCLVDLFQLMVLTEWVHLKIPLQ